MENAEILSVIAVVIAIISIIYNIVIHRKNIRMQEAVFHVERNVHFEGKLSEWPEAFEFYGVDLEKAKKEEITKEQITFMVLSMNSLISVATFRGITLKKELETNTYRKGMFSNEKTRKAWNYAKNCFGEETGKTVDEYIKNNFD